MVCFGLFTERGTAEEAEAVRECLDTGAQFPPLELCGLPAVAATMPARPRSQIGAHTRTYLEFFFKNDARENYLNPPQKIGKRGA